MQQTQQHKKQIKMIKPQPKKALSLLLSALCLTVLGNATYAHHSYSMFNRDLEKIISGTVVRWAFNNPHSWIYINVKEADGSETLWSFESAAPPQLIGRGITGKTFEPGNTVTLMYCPLVDGRNGGAVGWAKLADGNFIDPSDGGCNGSDANITRWKDLLEKGVMESAKVK